MKKALLFAAVFLFLFSAAPGARVGRMLVNVLGRGRGENLQGPGDAVSPEDALRDGRTRSFISTPRSSAATCACCASSTTRCPAMEHQRYQQYFSGLEVFGGEVVLPFQGQATAGHRRRILT